MPPKTSGKAAAKSGKATKAIVKGDKKKRKGKRKESYAIYIYKVGLGYLFRPKSCDDAMELPFDTFVMKTNSCCPPSETCSI